MFTEITQSELNDINGGIGFLGVTCIILAISAAANVFNGYSDAHFGK
ncbi:class IIb bacteriocin, lactobin A/cerein 7B family [Clostridium collagenovorans DSM 3089]|uniref:Class IIb bacteriocin, lactobin A/cerein 7B family n=1 Tax=Clostridium collagenovorans DSM 3089 TaxID=1121306 RepID=A0A1M5X5E2_9CLOT|nr:class IIb bacteriocin, lactobin A/cerein 7B family [Clostridium collagenovorans]SHH95036.1 class IIb bacteriocin, lactobin A/cerein 7B family [Clostridium collagenovorans DSM 3089]